MEGAWNGKSSEAPAEQVMGKLRQIELGAGAASRSRPFANSSGLGT